MNDVLILDSYPDHWHPSDLKQRVDEFRLAGIMGPPCIYKVCHYLFDQDYN